MIDWNYWQQDAGLKFQNAVFTYISCGLSGFCGWQMGADSGILVQIMSAGVMSMIAYSLSSAVIRVAQYRLARDRSGYYRNLGMAGLLLIMNIGTDYGASSTIRDISSKSAKNANVNAENARNEVKRLETKIANLQGEQAWRTKFEAPETYDALINKQKQITDRGRNVWQRTKECTDTTLEVSSRVCQKIAELQATKANAERRQVILSELKTAGEQLATAKQLVANSPEKTNIALMPVIAMRSLFTRDRDGLSVQDNLNYFLAVMTLVLSGAIIYLSTEIGVRKGPMTAPEPVQPKPRRSNYWIEQDYERVPDPELEPIALKSEDAPNKTETTTTTSTVNVYSRGANQKVLDELINEVLAGVQQDRESLARH